MTDTNEIPHIKIRSNARLAWLAAIIGGLLIATGVVLLCVLIAGWSPQNQGFLIPLAFGGVGAAVLFGSIGSIRDPPNPRDPE